MLFSQMKGVTDSAQHQRGPVLPQAEHRRFSPYQGSINGCERDPFAVPLQLPVGGLGNVLGVL